MGEYFNNLYYFGLQLIKKIDRILSNWKLLVRFLQTLIIQIQNQVVLQIVLN